MKRLVVITGLLLGATCAYAQQVVYVNASAPAGGSGNSWASAFRSLQDALAASQEGDELWIARGMYRADDGQGLTRGDTASAFLIRTRRALYGGFQGTETTLAARDFVSNSTILTGDLLGNDSDSLSYSEPSRRDNTLNLIRTETPTAEILLDGLTITGSRSSSIASANQASLTLRNFRLTRSGNLVLSGRLTAENGVFERNYGGTGGGAIYVLGGSLTARNVIFRGNRDTSSDAFNGGGGALRFFGGRADLSRVTFEDNRTPYDGGAIYSFVAPLRIVSARFVGNRARSAGAILVTRTRLTLSNAVFSGNEATLFDGGALVVEEPRNRPTQDSTLIFNSTFAGNRAAGCGGAIHAYRSYRTLIRNSVFFGNTAAASDPDLCRTTFDPATDLIRVGRSLFATPLPPGTLDESGNVAADPLFMNAAGPDGRLGTLDDDLRLGVGSRARDAGDARWLPADSLDLDGDGNLREPLPYDFHDNLRVQGANLDMGAYEANPTTSVASGETLVPGMLRIWPNPASSTLMVLLSVPGHILVTDALGRERLRAEVTGTEARLDVSSLPPGVYLVRTGSTSTQFVVVR